MKFPVAWGNNDYGQSRIPAGLTNVLQVAAGGDATLVLKLDETVLGWGSNAGGLTNVPAGLTNVVSLSATAGRVLALRRDGTVAAWGDSGFGTTNVPAGLTNAAAVAAGGSHNLVLLRDGTVTAWGWNLHGATNVPQGLGGVIAVAAGQSHSLALRNDGLVVAWGYNGTGATNVPQDLAGVAALAAGSYHSLALRSNGTVVAWGDNQFGQTNVPPGLTNVTAIAAGGNWNLAARSDGSLAAWGTPNYPAGSLPKGLTNLTAMAIGQSHVVALNDGSPYFTLEPTGKTIYSGKVASLTGSAVGLPPLEYRWQKDGLELPGVTSSTLTLTNAQVSHSGPYRLVVTNIAGRVVSSNATLTVSNSAPLLVLSPSGSTVYPGGRADLVSLADGSEPLAYEWRRGGVAIPGAAGSTYTVTNAQLSDEGRYAVAITNIFGEVLSAEVMLNVLELGEVLSTNELVWTTAGDAPWYPAYDPYHGRAARSGVITNHQSSVLRTTITGPGKLSFSWWVDSQPTFDYLSFSANGIEQARLSGSASEQGKTFYFGSGAHLLEWAYVKDAAGSSGQDAGWLNNLVYVPGATAPTVTTQPTATNLPVGWSGRFEVAAYGTPPLQFQWMRNDAVIIGATNASLLLTNVQAADEGTYRAVVSNASGTNYSASAALSLFSFIGPSTRQDELDRWYLRSPLVPGKIRYVNGRFIGVGPNGLLVTSTDGRTWAQQASGTTAELRGVAYGGGAFGRFFAVGTGGTILTSADATNWTPVVTAYTCDLNDISSAGVGTLVAGTTRSSTADPNVLVCSDGVNWSGKTFPNASGLPYVTSVVAARSGGIFVATGGSLFAYDIWRSGSGNAWTNAGFADQVVEGIAGANSRLILVGWEGWPRVSTNNGASWFPVSSEVIDPGALKPPYYMSPMVGSDVAYGNGTFVTVRGFLRNGLLLTGDGNNWSTRATFTGMSLNSIAYGNGRFVVVVTDGGTYPAGIYLADPAAGTTLTATVGSGSMRLLVSGEAGLVYRIQASTNLSNWLDRFTITNSAGSTEVIDPIPPNSRQLFYRAVTP